MFSGTLGLPTLKQLVAFLLRLASADYVMTPEYKSSMAPGSIRHSTIHVCTLRAFAISVASLVCQPTVLFGSFG